MKSLFFASALFFSFSCLAADPHYQIEQHIPLTGTDSWGFLSIDAGSNRLFVARGNNVDVVNLKTETVLGHISESVDGARGLAYWPKQNKGYISSEKSGVVAVFDLSLLKVLKEIPVAVGINAIVFEDTTSRIFSFNREAFNFTIIDANRDKVLKTVALDGTPGTAVADKGNVYVHNVEDNTIMVIDAKEMKVKKSWDLEDCESPTSLAADFPSRRLFSVCKSGKMEVTDIDRGKSITSFAVGNEPEAVVYDAGFVFSANGDGTLTVIQEKKPSNFEVLENVKIPKGSHAMVVDSKTHRVYLASASFEASDPANSKSPLKITPRSVELLVLKNK